MGFVDLFNALLPLFERLIELVYDLRSVILSFIALVRKLLCMALRALLDLKVFLPAEPIMPIKAEIGDLATRQRMQLVPDTNIIQPVDSNQSTQFSCCDY